MTIPTLETFAGLYRAAYEAGQQADAAMANLRASILKHGFSEQQVCKAAGLAIERPVKRELSHA